MLTDFATRTPELKIIRASHSWIHHSPFIIEISNQQSAISTGEGNGMAIDPELLEILACPNCKTKVELVKDGTALKCGQCKRVYPIKDDIPVMLLDEATIEQ
jgi:uncharacterized protein